MLTFKEGMHKILSLAPFKCSIKRVMMSLLMVSTCHLYVTPNNFVASKFQLRLLIVDILGLIQGSEKVYKFNLLQAISLFLPKPHTICRLVIKVNFHHSVK